MAGAYDADALWWTNLSPNLWDSCWSWTLFVWCPSTCNLFSDSRPWCKPSGRAIAIVHKTLAIMKAFMITLVYLFINSFRYELFCLVITWITQTELNNWCLCNWTPNYLYLIHKTSYIFRVPRIRRASREDALDRYPNTTSHSGAGKQTGFKYLTESHITMNGHSFIHSLSTIIKRLPFFLRLL